jgi:hypothetical protein
MFKTFLKKSLKKVLLVQSIVLLLTRHRNNQTHKHMTKQITSERISKVIIAVLSSPNKSAQRAGLWARLQNLKAKHK